jgi:hypothetical protein
MTQKTMTFVLTLWVIENSVKRSFRYTSHTSSTWQDYKGLFTTSIPQSCVCTTIAFQSPIMMLFKSHSYSQFSNMYTMKTFILFLAQCLAVSLALSPEASSGGTRGVFTPRPTPAATPSSFRLYGQGLVLPPPSGFEMHEERAQVLAPACHLSSKVELPRRHFPSPFALQRSEMLVNTEMTVGRVAMVAAVVLFTFEVTTGQSLPDQISALCNLYP